MLYSNCTRTGNTDGTDSTDSTVPQRYERKGRNGVFEIDLRGGKGAIYQQLKAEVIRLCGMGVLAPDDQLPSVRTLARELGINPNTVAKAYSQLEADGITYSVAGKGSFIRGEPEQMRALRERALNTFTLAVKRARETGLSEEELTGAVRSVYAAPEETAGENNGEGMDKT